MYALILMFWVTPITKCPEFQFCGRESLRLVTADTFNNKIECNDIADKWNVDHTSLAYCRVIPTPNEEK